MHPPLRFPSTRAVALAAVSAEVYREIASPTLPAIPLLPAAGYILAERGASTRLVRFFRALFGRMPGDLAVMVAAVCAVFTTFTGGSGVTIIALGGLVYPILRDDGYPEGFSLGLVTAAGRPRPPLPAEPPRDPLQRGGGRPGGGSPSQGSGPSSSVVAICSTTSGRWLEPSFSAPATISSTVGTRTIQDLRWPDRHIALRIESDATGVPPGSLCHAQVPGRLQPVKVKVADVLRRLAAGGWAVARTRGSHRQFKHASKPGIVTVAGKPSDDVAPGTLNSILKQAGLKP